jgi:hypothetical protein
LDTNWSGCTATCGPSSSETAIDKGGNEYKNFTVTTPASNGGAACPPQESRPCSKKCKVDCKGSWSTCDSEYGAGVQTYTVTTAPSPDGAACPYNNNDRRFCNGKSGSRSGLMFLKDNGSGMDWRKGTSDWWCIHPEGGSNKMGFGLVLYDGCYVDQDRLRYTITYDGGIIPAHGWGWCLGDRGEKVKNKKGEEFVRPTWGTGDCLKFGTEYGGDVRLKSITDASRHNYCLQPLEDDNAQSVPVVLKPCTMKIIY